MALKCGACLVSVIINNKYTYTSPLAGGTWAKVQYKVQSINTFFPKMVSVILGSSYHADVCSSVNF